jgi:hypothetical protein
MPPRKDRYAYDDFYAAPSLNKFIYRPLGELWPRESIDSILPPMALPAKHNGKTVKMKPSDWLMLHSAVDQITWMPGWDEIIQDKLLTEGGWEAHPSSRVYNRYKAPNLAPGDPNQAGLFIDHVKLIFPDEADEILDWFAHRAQRPGEKINHALVMGSGQGIGKDWLLKALKYAVGAHNFITIRPDELLDKNNAFVETVVLLVNETHDLGETGGRLNRFALYERLKLYAASPPDVLSSVDKYVKRRYVPNVLGLAVVMNHKTDGVHLESDDRRHLVAWSEKKKEDFTEESWTEKYNWLDNGGHAHVTAYLMQRDLSGFNPCALPRQTPAFFEIVHASTSPDDAALADALDELDRPDAVTVAMLLTTSRAASMPWLENSHRAIPHRLERCGYVAVSNPNATSDGLWCINKRRQMIYVKATLTSVKKLEAAWELMKPKSATAKT